MKTVFAMILMLVLNDASAFEVKVSRMKKVSGYTQRYDLKNSLNEKVFLDCQSFVQGLEFGAPGENVVMLAEWECDELIVDMKASHSQFKKHCLEIDPENSVLESHGSCP